MIVFTLATSLLRSETASAPNRLIHEKSPYLREHACNPVDWFPWGEEAFAKARRENKPIFLSIGYSTCHWCHVMARESFSNPEIAALLNANFVCIKVDREERPDVDRVYLTFVEASTGAGGWPMSVWLTPELKPFLGGTYYAPESHGGRPGIKTVLTRVAEMWRKDAANVRKKSAQMLAQLTTDTAPAEPAKTLALADWRQKAFEQAVAGFDPTHGGFEPAPKFARPALLGFLLEESATGRDAPQRGKALAMVVKTLREIADGGIHDQLGGGFHRYSVDARWHVPHFEKMLYDQAQLASVLLSAWQLSGDPALKAAARDTLGYVQRDMCAEAGGFYSAEDADSARGRTLDAGRAEGAFYVWSQAEVTALVGEKDAGLLAFAFGLERDGNAGGDELAGQNVLHRTQSTQKCARKFGISAEAVDATIGRGLERLREARAKRPRPARDEKIVTAWNGLMISAFARGAQVLDDPKLAKVATRAAEFLQERLYEPATGRLARSYCREVKDERGFAEDYAFLVEGLLDLYETSFDVRWLTWAVALQEKQNELFLDSAGGGYFANTSDDPSVLLRLKADDDGVEPAASSVATRNLLRLAALFHRDDWRDLAEKTGRAFAPVFERAPTAMPQLLAALGWLEGSPKQVVIQGAADSPETRRLVHEVWQRFLPRHVLLRVDAASRAYFAERVPLIGELPEARGDEATAYVCENFVCQLPTRDPEQLVKLLTR